MILSYNKGRDLWMRAVQVQWPQNTNAQMQQRLQVSAQRQGSGSLPPPFRGPGNFSYFGALHTPVNCKEALAGSVSVAWCCSRQNGKKMICC